MLHLINGWEFNAMALKLDGESHLPTRVSAAHVGASAPYTAGRGGRPDAPNQGLCRFREPEAPVPDRQFVFVQHGPAVTCFVCSSAGNYEGVPFPLCRNLCPLRIKVPSRPPSRRAPAIRRVLAKPTLGNAIDWRDWPGRQGCCRSAQNRVLHRSSFTVPSISKRRLGAVTAT